MYLEHFGLREPPFKIVPNAEFFYAGGNRGPVLEALLYAIAQGEGIVKVTGEVGSGKTMLCTMLQARLPQHVETVYIANPGVSPEEILRAIAFELGLKLPRESAHLEVMQAVHDYLLERHGQGRQVVVFVEESQNMPVATLEEVRLLSNLETRHHKLLQIVLFGQPELDETLRRPDIRQLRDRITHSFRLAPLPPQEVGEYLAFRLRQAGYRGPELFGPSVVKAIARASGGLTRRINLLADKTLLAAFAQNTHTLRPHHVRSAVRDSEFARAAPGGPLSAWAWVAAALLLGAGLGIAGYVFLHDGAASGGSPPRERAAAAIDAARPESPQPRPAPAAAPAQDPTEAGDDLVAARLAATERWLAEQKPDTFTIQLLGTESPQQLKQHLNVLGKFLEINEVFVYRTVARQRPVLTVVYGTFGDRRAAQEALSRLPGPLRANAPLLRTVQGIRTEIAAARPS